MGRKLFNPLRGIKTMRQTATIHKVLRLTAGQYHCWCDSNAGIIRKENCNIPRDIWNPFAINIGLKSQPEISWWQKLWNWILKIIK